MIWTLSPLPPMVTPTVAERAEGDEQRRRFRAFALAHHPDRGGDPEEFMAGLAALRRGRAAADDIPSVYRRRRGVAGWLGLGRPRSPSRSLD